jgi:Leucine-rich repeat (LRR) protein
MKLLKGNGTYFVQPDGTSYGPCVDFIRSHPGESLTLRLERALPLRPLLDLDGISEIRKITCWRKDTDVRLLESLHQLESVNLAEPQAFDFSGLRHLRTAGGVWSSQWRGLANCSELETFHVSAYKRPDLTDLATHQRLRRVTLITTSVASLKGIHQLPELEYIEVYRGSALANVSSLNGAASLKELRIEGCRKISDYDAITNLPALEQLTLDKCGPVLSLAFIAHLPELRLISLEGTELVDKDLTPCLTHPKLRWVYVTGRGYSPDAAEVKQALSLRYDTNHH